MPNVSSNIRRQLNVPTFDVLKEKENYDSENIVPDQYSHPVFFNQFYNFIKEGHQIGKAEPLFKRIGDAEVKEWKAKFGGVQEKKPDEKNPKDKKAKDKVKKEKSKDGEKKTEKTATNQQQQQQQQQTEISQ